MKSVFLFYTILSSLGCTHAVSSTLISKVEPRDDAEVYSIDGSVTFSAEVIETMYSVKSVKIDLRINGTKQYNPMNYMSHLSNTDYYEYVGGGFEEGIEYCFRLRGRNSEKSNTWSEYNCFTVVTSTESPTPFPSLEPTSFPTLDPTSTPQPTYQPSVNPTAPTPTPSYHPSFSPTLTPVPTLEPTPHPTQHPSLAPTPQPTSQPSVNPTAPTPTPTYYPTSNPTESADPTPEPTFHPTPIPSSIPTLHPTSQPSAYPTVSTATPTHNPTVTTPVPVSKPSRRPTAEPSLNPTPIPTAEPTSLPTYQPTPVPTSSPTIQPTYDPTVSPTSSPTSHPTSDPTISPTSAPNANTESDKSTITYGLQPDCDTPDSSKFSICLDLTSASGKVEDFMSYFATARDAWERVIVSNGVYLTDMSQMSESHTATGKYPPVIDGMYIASNIESIDGQGGILGSAAPVYYLTFEDGLYRPVTGVMNFDAHDLEWMDAEGLLKGVIMHEMGHVLGIGTLWRPNDLVNYPDGDLYLGSNVVREWTAQGCELDRSGAPIVEMDGSAGTAGGHFDETCFDEELMTGYVDQGMILSSLTVASLEDMGYNVDYSQAEPFDFAGDCCSGARRGRRGRRLRGLSERRLSPENKETATEYGQMVLKKFNCQKATEFEQSEKLLLLDTVKVYVLQDGHVIDVEVTLDEYEASP